MWVSFFSLAIFFVSHPLPQPPSEQWLRHVLYQLVRYSVTVNISRFHREARGSIPRTGVIFCLLTQLGKQPLFFCLLSCILTPFHAEHTRFICTQKMDRANVRVHLYPLLHARSITPHFYAQLALRLLLAICPLARITNVVTWRSLLGSSYQRNSFLDPSK